MTIRFTDRVSVGSTKQTAEGYLVATARVARTGVQSYLASELGDIAYQNGFKESDVVRVYRHPDEVFAADTLTSITRVPVTLNHPPESVNADNWSTYAVGEVGDAYSTDAEWIVVNPMIKDGAAIEAARSTHKEVSMGYEANIIKARDGIDADFEMAGIKMNHLALVPKGRAGDKARIGDAWGATPVNDFKPGNAPTTEEVSRMTDQLKTVVLGDKAVQVAVTDVAAIEQFKSDMQQKLDEAVAEKQASIQAKDEEIGQLKADLKAANDAASIDVDALVAARSELVAKAHAIDSEIDVTGKTDAELRKAAVASKLGDEMVADASDAEINGMFKAVAKDAKPANPVADVIRRGLQPVSDAASRATDAWNGSVHDLNAWRKEA